MTVKASDLAYTPARAVREWAVRSARDLWLNVVGFSLTFCAAAVLAVGVRTGVEKLLRLGHVRGVLLELSRVAMIYQIFAKGREILKEDEPASVRK